MEILDICGPVLLICAVCFYVVAICYEDPLTISERKQVKEWKATKAKLPKVGTAERKNIKRSQDSA